MKPIRSFKIDIEPRWVNLCNMADRGYIKASALLPACEMTDVIRQAQKTGAKSVTFRFANRKAQPRISIRRR